MNKLKILGFVLLTVLMSISVYAADGCVQNQSCMWYAFNVPTSYTGANITFTLPDTTQTAEFSMTALDAETYYYNSSFAVIGNVLGCVKVYNSTDSVTDCESKEIYINEASEELDMLAELLEPFIIFLVGILLLAMAYAGETRSAHIFGIAAGVWWLGSATVILFSGVLITSIFFMLIGVATVLISVGEIIKTKGEE